ncbi:MAG: glycosyltransferase [Candidatus Cloacimonetes bacterium]|nr:glycosyltransferase [Candidatus Cloacimonadota bacterium]
MLKILMLEDCDYINSIVKIGSQHYGRELAEDGNQVLWLTPPYNELYLLKDKEEYYIRKTAHKNNFQEVEKNLRVYCPHSLVIAGQQKLFNTKLFHKLSVDLCMPNIKSKLKKHSFDNVDVLFMNNMRLYYLKDKVKYKKMFYRCNDDKTLRDAAYDNYNYFENDIIKKSDIVFVTSMDLLEKKQKIRKDLVYLPNGVELENFIRDEYRLPEDFTDTQRKKCIFVGAFASWLDVELVEYSAKMLKDIDFYIIGPVKTDVECLKKLSNVKLLGVKPYIEIPDYLYHSDVAIIPFKINSFTNSITPVKLYEYMSLGLNVVTTDFREMQFINSPAYIAKHKDDFCDKILLSIKNKSVNKETNITFAKENTWVNRYLTIKKYL